MFKSICKSEVCQLIRHHERFWIIGVTALTGLLFPSILVASEGVDANNIIDAFATKESLLAWGAGSISGYSFAIHTAMASEKAKSAEYKASHDEYMSMLKDKFNEESE